MAPNKPTPEFDIVATLLGRTVALDLLLRAVYAQWAASTPDPERFVFATIEGIIGTMDQVDAQPQTEADQRIWDHARIELESFAEQVCLRLSATPPASSATVMPNRGQVAQLFAEFGPELVEAINGAVRNGARLRSAQ